MLQQQRINPNGAGTGTAPSTLKANAGKPHCNYFRRDLVETFGDPLFKTDTTIIPINGGELNEYGLQAAYSLLGVSNRAYVVRADVDLGELEASSDAPSANPLAGTYWFDTANTKYGIQQWNSNPINTTGGQTFTTKTPYVIYKQNEVVDYDGGNYAP